LATDQRSAKVREPTFPRRAAAVFIEFYGIVKISLAGFDVPARPLQPRSSFDVDRLSVSINPVMLDAAGGLPGDRLSAEILDRLARAAELCSVTDLKTCIAELDASGTIGPIVRELKRCAKAYDMPGVKRVLAHVSSVSMASSPTHVEVS